jgi:hypothetical protein
MAGFRMVLRPQVSLTSCARVKDVVSATFELTFFERYWSMAMGREGEPCD